VVKLKKSKFQELGLEEVKGLKPIGSYDHFEGRRSASPRDVPRRWRCLVGKTSPPRFLEETGAGAFLQAQERRESSMPIRHGEKGWVDNVYVTESLDSGRLGPMYGSFPQGP